MADAKHTPGPWMAIDDETAVRVLSAVDETWIAECNRWEHSEDVANAHLIAAAPDLIAALEEAAAYIPHADIAERARAAIKKARGEK